MYIYINIYIHIYINMYIYMYIYSYIHMYILQGTSPLNLHPPLLPTNTVKPTHTTTTNKHSLANAFARILPVPQMQRRSNTYHAAAQVVDPY